MLINNGSSDSDVITWQGGKGIVEVTASTWGTVTLQRLGLDGSTWVDVGVNTTFGSNGLGGFNLEGCQLKLAVSGASGVYANITENHRG